MPSKPGPKPSKAIIKRNEEIVAKRFSMTLEELSGEYGISRERVRQICEAAGVNAAQAGIAVTQARRAAQLAEAEQEADAIIMMYVQGHSVAAIARQLNLTHRSIKSILSEKVNDQITAARANYRAGGKDIPDNQGTARADRFWTHDQCLEAVQRYVKKHGGRLPAIDVYEADARLDPNLPSSATLRNRLGRWTTIRVKANNQ